MFPTIRYTCFTCIFLVKSFSLSIYRPFTRSPSPSLQEAEFEDQREDVATGEVQQEQATKEVSPHHKGPSPKPKKKKAKKATPSTDVPEIGMVYTYRTFLIDRIHYLTWPFCTGDDEVPIDEQPSTAPVSKTVEEVNVPLTSPPQRKAKRVIDQPSLSFLSINSLPNNHLCF